MDSMGGGAAKSSAMANEGTEGRMKIYEVATLQWLKSWPDYLAIDGLAC